MTNEPKRPRFLDRQQAAATPEEARRNRSTAMIGWGGLAAGLGVVGAVGGENAAVALAVFLLGALLLVGGLVIR